MNPAKRENVRPEVVCARIAAKQHGCISRGQALEAQMSPDAIKRALASGKWRELYRRSYCVPAVPASWLTLVSGALLWLGRDSAVSHSSAAALWKIAGFDQDSIELSTLRARQSRYSHVVVHRVKSLNPHEVGLLLNLRVTSPARTLIDLSGVTAEDRFEEALHDCLRRRLVSLPRLELAIRNHSGPGRTGAPLLRKMMALYRDCKTPESPLETRFARLLRSSALPAAERQHQLTLRQFGRVRLDFAWPERRVAVEVDGYSWHSSRTSWERDRLRTAALEDAGWRILHVTDGDLKGDPSDVLGRLARALGGTLF